MLFACQPLTSFRRPHPAPSLSGHKQAAPRAAAPREEEAAGGAAPAESPREQEQPQGQERSGGQRAGHLGEDLCCSQHLTPLPAGVVRSEWKWRAVPRLPRRPALGPRTEPTRERTLGVSVLRPPLFLSTFC